MAVEDVSRNLRFLCSYGKSVSDICRRLKINRQQFNRYLSGASTPSLHTIRRICDFFGIDDHELFLDYGEFHDLIRLRPPKIEGSRDDVHDFFERLCRPSSKMLKNLERYAGYYYVYFQPDRHDPTIYRNVMFLYKGENTLLSRQVEHYPDREYNLPEIIKHEGVVYSVANRLVITELEEFTGASLWQTILYGSDYSTISLMPGLSLGIAPESAQDIVCYRVVWEYLGQDVDLRTVLKGGGKLERDAPENNYIREAVSNNFLDSETAFTPRV